jgi:hypothetical protein
MLLVCLGCNLLLAACEPESFDRMPMNPDGDDEDDGIACMAELTVTGTMDPEGEPPSVDAGCVPEGVWTVNVAVADAGDCEQVPVQDQYVYVITRDEQGDQLIEYQGNEAEAYNMAISATGSGDCYGTFEHLAVGGNYVLLKPFETELSLSGSGYYELREL